MSAAIVEQLLRDRPALLARLRDEPDPRAVVAPLIATIAVAMALVGAALGSYRGGAQIAYAAIKLPLVLLGTAALSAPVLSAFGAALGRRVRFGADLALVLAALAFGALLLAAATPLLLLARALDVGYHDAILATVALFAVAGLAALQLVVRGIAREGGAGWRTAVAGLCVVFVAVGGQLAWALRPYLVRPREVDVPFVRAVEGSLVDAVSGSLSSARGVYTRERAP